MKNQASSEKPGRRKSLPDKYWSLAIVTALLFVNISTNAQTQSGALQYINAKGYVWKQGGFDSSLRGPLDTFKLRTSDKSAQAIVWTSDTTFRTAAWNGFKWVLSCDCGSSVTPGSPLAISSHPSSLTRTVGASATFTVAATGGTAPYTYQWQKAGSNISGAVAVSYIISSTSIPDSGNYRAIVTDATSATVTSNYAYLTVNEAVADPVITYGWSTTDPYVDNSTAPTVSNSATTTITSGANISVSYTSAAVDKFLIIKIPSSQPTPTIWYSTSFNNGTIPDATFRAVFTVGSFKYLVSRDGAGVAFDHTVPFQFNH